jgi:D-glycero-alpha-D-manno-heptose-7-phosphate kinase
MIITRSPLRISLGGGGTDLPSYYKKHEGFLIAATINQYVYTSINENFRSEILLKYSSIEKVSNINMVKHPIIRECLKKTKLEKKNLEISSMADIPAGTGLGSSGSFTTSLLKGLHEYKKETIKKEELASEACKIEIDILREPIGKQDQYVSAYGGLRCFKFNKDGTVRIRKLNIKKETKNDLEENLLLFYTGFSRSASKILNDQNKKSKLENKQIINNLNEVKRMGLDTKKSLESGDISSFTSIMNEHWLRKKERYKGMSNTKIDDLYEIGKKNGADSGKIIGAGGGGFLMFYSSDKFQLRKKMKELNIREVEFLFEEEGTKLITKE